MTNPNKYEIYAKRLIYLGIFTLVISSLLFLFKTTKLDLRNNINTDVFGHFGAFIGGLLGAFFSLAGIYLLILNLRSQENYTKKQQIESRFFELLKIHRENTKELTIQEKSGKEIFKWLQKELFICFQVIYEFKERKSIELQIDEIINIAYISFYYGAVGKYSSRIVFNLLQYLKKDDFIKDLLDEFETRKEELSNGFPYKVFDGHQIRLGHYFRHLFQTVKYINNQPANILSFEEKYQYIKTLRAQFTNQEQVVFFFNSLSSLGKKWEKDDKCDTNNQLITKYNLIKNIPMEYISFTSPRNFYPNVEYENDFNYTKEKMEMMKIYRQQQI